MANELDRINSVRKAWDIASQRGYFGEAIVSYTAPDFLNFSLALIPGLLTALLIPIVGQVGGSLAGTALGMLVTAVTGQAEVVPVLANLGRVIGGLAADAVLVYLGVMFIKDFIMPRLGGVGEHLGKGIWTAWKAVEFGSTGEARQQDQAAREMAEGVGLLMGLVLMGLVLYLTKGPAERISKMNESMLARTCPGLVRWIIENNKWLQERYANGPTKVAGGASPPPPEPIPPAIDIAGKQGSIASVELTQIKGGLAGSTASALTIAKQTVNRVLPFLVSRDRTVKPPSLKDMDAWLVQFGFRLVRAEPFGKDKGNTGWQLFWQNGNVLVRFKTTGDERGPREGVPHLSIGFNDAKGFDWQNDMAKFTYEGKVVAKVITDPAKFNPTDFQGNSQRFVLLPTNFDIGAVDAWAARTHFNAGKGFSLDGLKNILGRAGH